jgi:DNA mismatch endonuclease (patch repair protein)
MHDCPFGRVVPKTNAEFWQAKRQSNVDRDQNNLAELKELGWEVLVIWECEVKNLTELEATIRAFLT